MRGNTNRRHLLFGLAIALQLAILLAIPRGEILARTRGREITLETRPNDPYNVLSGYSVTLAYAIERPADALVEKGLGTGEPVYFTVEEDTPAWRLVSVTRARPDPKSNRVSIKGAYWSWSSSLKSADRLYIPESERAPIADAMRASQGKGLVDLKVDGHGNVAVLRLHVGGRTFGQ